MKDFVLNTATPIFLLGLEILTFILVITMSVLIIKDYIRK